MMRLLPILAPLALTGCIALPDGAAASHAAILLLGLAWFGVLCMVMALPFVTSARH